MKNNRQLFLNHVAQTSPAPMALEIERAEGIYLYDASNKKYIDLIAGISVCNVGHCRPEIIEAVNAQMKRHAHLMVYGEYIQYPQTKLAEELSKLLSEKLSSVYFTNSGAEATEGAMKLAKRVTGRTEIFSFRNAYHGSTQGALSIMGSEDFKNSFRPLLPDTRILEFNNEKEIELITKNTAAVFIEVVQAESGVIVGTTEFFRKLRAKCDETGTLLVFDEIQTGLGRTGKMFAFEHLNVVPDVLLLGKALGGGLPLGAFIASKKLMDSFTENPVLGHITTFGGNPVCCAAALASLKIIQQEKLIDSVEEKNKIIHSELKHPFIKEIRSKGLLVAIEFGDVDLNMKIISKCIENGVITDWFLFCATAMRIAPPLTISNAQLKEACKIIVASI
ncbi:MAG: aspartate aminotransferase family protein [Bacteroidia bacterium]|nr:aspartate aminotransferase family protein [Bacteroidia bacterium]